MWTSNNLTLCLICQGVSPVTFLNHILLYVQIITIDWKERKCFCIETLNSGLLYITKNGLGLTIKRKIN